MEGNKKYPLSAHTNRGENMQVIAHSSAQPCQPKISFIKCNLICESYTKYFHVQESDLPDLSEDKYNYRYQIPPWPWKIFCCYLLSMQYSKWLLQCDCPIYKVNSVQRYLSEWKYVTWLSKMIWHTGVTFWKDAPSWKMIIKCDQFMLPLHMNKRLRCSLEKESKNNT